MVREVEEIWAAELSEVGVTEAVAAEGGWEAAKEEGAAKAVVLVAAA